MTILIYDNTTAQILVDSRASWENGRPPATVSKVRKLEWKGEEVVSASSGIATISNAYLFACLAAIVDETYIVKAPAKEFGGFAVFFSFRGKLWMSEGRFEDQTKASDVVDLSLCLYDVVAGSGGTFHAAYMAAGYSVLESTRMTALYHETCGLPLRFIHADGTTGIVD